MVAHPVILRGLAAQKRNSPAMVVQRTDSDFLPAILNQLESEPGRQTLLAQALRVDVPDGWTFGQPVHQMFQVALFEVCCDTVGLPRLDPSQIDSAGLVIRRVVAAPQGGAPAQYRWLRHGDAVHGWHPMRTEQDGRQDPDAERRPDPLFGIPDDVRQAVQGLRPPLAALSEHVTALYVAPTAICRAAGRTILYGLVPVTSSERAASAIDEAGAGYDLDFVRQHLVGYLRASTGQLGNPTLPVVQSIPAPGQIVDRSAASRPEFAAWVMLLRQLTIELGIFDDTRPQQDPARRLLRLLNTLQVSAEAPSGVKGALTPLGDLLATASRVFVEQAEGVTVRMPSCWPAISDLLADELAVTAKEALDARLQTLQPALGRFDDSAAQFCLRGFVRVKCRDACPPQLYWSTDSPAYSILPWYEAGARRPARIELPPIDRQIIRKLKPNVSFVVPGKLFDFMQSNDPLKILQGEATEGSGLGMRWICGFNIPIITLCAFILLYVILVLLNIVFWWLPFVRVCLPLPEKKA